MFKTSGGLQVVYLSGRHDADRFSEDLSSQENMVSPAFVHIIRV